MKKEFSIVCISVFLLVLGTFISGSLFVPYARTLGGSSLTIGLIYSSMYVVRLIFGTPIGWLSQKKGAKRVLVYSLMLYPLIAVAYWVSWNIPSLLAARLLHGVASAMMLPMAMAYIGEISPQGQEGRYMGLYNLITFSASGIGPVVGGFIYESYGIKEAFLTLFVLALLALLLILIMGRMKTPMSAPSRAGEARGDTQYNAKALLYDKRLWGLACINIVSAVLLALFGASFTEYALGCALNMKSIGVLIAVNNMVIGVAQIPLGKFSDRYSKTALVMVSAAATSLLLILFLTLKSFWSIGLLLVVIGVAIALHFSASAAISAVVGKQCGMSVTMGFLSSVNSTGTIIGYLLLGFITDTFGIENTFYFTACLFIFGNLLFLLCWRLYLKTLKQERID